MFHILLYQTPKVIFASPHARSVELDTSVPPITSDFNGTTCFEVLFDNGEVDNDNNGDGVAAVVPGLLTAAAAFVASKFL